MQYVPGAGDLEMLGSDSEQPYMAPNPAAYTQTESSLPYGRYMLPLANTPSRKSGKSAFGGSGLVSSPGSGSSSRLNGSPARTPGSSNRLGRSPSVRGKKSPHSATSSSSNTPLDFPMIYGSGTTDAFSSGKLPPNK